MTQPTSAAKISSELAPKPDPHSEMPPPETTSKPDSHSKIGHDIMETYGPLIEIGDLANLLHRGRESIRKAVVYAKKNPDADNTPEWALVLANSECRIGKKILFHTRAVIGLVESGA